MIKLICAQGSLGYDGESYVEGDVIEATDEMAAHLLHHRLAVKYVEKTPPPPVMLDDEPEPEPEAEEELTAAPTPEPEPEPEPEEEPDPTPIPDISTLSNAAALKVINQADSPEELKAHLDTELATKKRKGIIEAINTKRSE